MHTDNQSMYYHINNATGALCCINKVFNILSNKAYSIKHIALNLYKVYSINFKIILPN